MKKNDWILIAVILVIAAGFMGFHFLNKNTGNGMAEIRVDGEIYGTYPLNKEQTIEINDTNRLEIREGSVEMTWAACPDQICVHHRKISRDGESIICLPNQVVVSVIGGEEPKLDAVAN